MGSLNYAKENHHGNHHQKCQQEDIKNRRQKNRPDSLKNDKGNNKLPANPPKAAKPGMVFEPVEIPFHPKIPPSKKRLLNIYSAMAYNSPKPPKNLDKSIFPAYSIKK